MSRLDYPCRAIKFSLDPENGPWPIRPLPPDERAATLCASGAPSGRGRWSSSRRSRMRAGLLDFVYDRFAAALPHPQHRRRLCRRLIPDTSIPARPSGAVSLIRGRGKHLERDPLLCERQQDRVALHRAAQVHAERLLRELQRAHAQRGLERNALSRPLPGAREDRRL